MRWYIKLLLLLMLALPLGAAITVVGSKPSYLLIGYDNSILETNLGFALFVLVIVAAITTSILYLLFKTVFLSRKFITWKRDRKLKYADFQVKAGLLALTEGKWQRAEQQFISALSNNEQQLMAYLGAARAANHLGRHSARDKYLENAKMHVDGSKLAADIARAELQLESGQLNESLETLSPLYSQSPSHPQVLKLLQQAYLKLSKWEELRLLLPRLDKNVLSPKELGELAKTVYINQLKTLAEQKKRSLDEQNKIPYVNDLTRVWESRPKSLKQNPEVLKAFVEGLLLLGADKQAEAVLSQTLPKCWNNDLVLLYGQLAGDSEKQLTQAREWLKTHADSEALQLTLGRICVRAGDKQEAKKYFEASLAIHQTLDAYKELGKLLSAQGELERSNEYLLLGTV